MLHVALDSLRSRSWFGLPGHFFDYDTTTATYLMTTDFL